MYKRQSVLGAAINFLINLVVVFVFALINHVPIGFNTLVIIPLFIEVLLLSLIHIFGKDKLKDYDQLLLVNDTNIGPMRDLSQVFQEMADKQLDVYKRQGH